MCSLSTTGGYTLDAKFQRTSSNTNAKKSKISLLVKPVPNTNVHAHASIRALTLHAG